MNAPGVVMITIVDWNKFNPRTDSKNHTWFRFENSFFVKTFSWSQDEQRLFTYLCCVCSQEKKNPFKFDIELSCALLKRKSGQLNQQLKLLESRGVVTLSYFKLPEVSISESVPTYDTNVRTNDTYMPNFDFEALYKKYPRKLGKKAGIDKCGDVITTKEQYEKLSLAIDSFVKHHTKKQTKEEFIPYFSTFMSDWEMWLEPDTGSVKLPKPLPPRNDDLSHLEGPHPGGKPLDPKIKELLHKAKSGKSIDEEKPKPQ